MKLSVTLGAAVACVGSLWVDIVESIIVRHDILDCSTALVPLHPINIFD